MKRIGLALSLCVACGVADAQQYVISRFAGGGLPVTPAPAVKTAIGNPQRLDVDSSVNVYFASFSSVFKVDRKGLLTLLAGTGLPGYSGDDGPAVNAQLAKPEGIAVDRAGNVFVSDPGTHTVRKIGAGGGITTVAG